MDVGLSPDRTPFSGSSGAVVAHPRTGRLVLFDLDRTLISGSSLTTLAIVAARQRLIGPRDVARVIRNNAVFTVAGERGDIAATARSGVLHAIAGHHVSDFADVAEITVRRLAARVRPEMKRAVDLHLGLGDSCVIVSASPHEVVDGLASHLGMSRGVGTAGEIIDGVYTGRLTGAFCHGVGKLTRLREVLGHIDLSSAVCYADSMSDLPLLEAVRVPIVVAPDKALRRVAVERCWSIHH